MTPVLPLLLAWLGICSIGYAAGVSTDLLRTASQSALVPTWFLAAYVLVVAITPVTLTRSSWASSTTSSCGPASTSSAMPDGTARWTGRDAAWRATITVNARIMTLYLWHMTAMLAIVGVSLTLGGRGLHLEPATGAWWATRPVWFAICAVVTVALIAVFGRLENPSIDRRPAPRTWRPALATIAVCGGLAVMATSGIVSGDGVHWIWPVLPVVALLTLRVVPLRTLAPRG